MRTGFFGTRKEREVGVVESLRTAAEHEPSGVWREN